MNARLSVATGLLFVSVSCGGSPSPPVSPSTPTPTPVPTPTPGPSMTDPNSPIYCVPSPPPLYTFRLNVFADVGYRKLLDSTPLVGKSFSYCGEIGLGGDICVVRTEGDPLAVTCGNAVAGRASDTGRYGPKWYRSDKLPKDTGSFGVLCRPVTDTTDALGCRNHETNQFMLWAYGPGVYTACGANGVCHSLSITE